MIIQGVRRKNLSVCVWGGGGGGLKSNVEA